MQPQRHSCHRTGNNVFRRPPVRPDHAEAGIDGSVPELKREITRLDVNSRCRDEDGFETDTLGANISMHYSFRALAHGTYCLEILGGEAVFVAFNNNFVGPYFEVNEWRLLAIGCLGEPVVIRILQKFENKSGAAAINMFRKARTAELLIHGNWKELIEYTRFDGCRSRISSANQRSSSL